MGRLLGRLARGLGPGVIKDRWNSGEILHGSMAVSALDHVMSAAIAVCKFSANATGVPLARRRASSSSTDLAAGRSGRVHMEPPCTMHHLTAPSRAAWLRNILLKQAIDDLAVLRGIVPSFFAGDISPFLQSLTIPILAIVRGATGLYSRSPYSPPELFNKQGRRWHRSIPPYRTIRSVTRKISHTIPRSSGFRASAWTIELLGHWCRAGDSFRRWLIDALSALD